MYDPDAFRRTHDKILKAIGAEHIRFHDLRHTFATLSLKSGVDVKTLSGALGHYSAGFTLNTYTHATAQMKQDAADTIGGVISQQMREKNRARQEKSCLALSGTFRAFPRVGRRVSLEETTKIKCLEKLQIMKENHRNQKIPVIFGGDYWTRKGRIMFCAFQ